jgi:3-hydroxybutyryl-CoA dehydratase
MQLGKKIDDLYIGQKASLERQITESDVMAFARITGDFNPVHVDAQFASQTRFKERIAHGMLTASLISAVIGTILPGPGNIYVSQTLEFKAPVKFGDKIKAEVEIIEKISNRNRIRLKTTCTNNDNVIVLVGEAVIMPRS